MQEMCPGKVWACPSLLLPLLLLLLLSSTGTQCDAATAQGHTPDHTPNGSDDTNSCGNTTQSHCITDSNSCPLLPCHLPSLAQLHTLLLRIAAPGYNCKVGVVLCGEGSELDMVLTFRGVQEVHISTLGGANWTHKVTCQGNDSGLEFTGVNRVALEGVALVGCGFSSDGHMTSILVEESSKVVLEGVRISGGTGVGVWLQAVQESIVSDFEFERNLNGEMARDSASGIILQIEQNSTFHQIRNSHFSLTPKTSLTPVHTNFTRGGGLSVTLCDRCSGNHVSVSHSTFQHNHAQVGGAVYIRVQGSAQSNTIEITGSEFTNNHAVEGGAISVRFIASSGEDPSRPHGNQLVIEQCNFTSNSAERGGALQLTFAPGAEEKNSCAQKQNRFTLKDCLWTGNTAHVGAAIDLRPYTRGQRSAGRGGASAPVVTLEDCNFEDNMVKWRGNQAMHYRGEGAVRATDSELTISGELKMHGNSGSALYLESSCVKFARDSDSTFSGNTGYQGAAIALMGFESVIHVAGNSSLLFRENTAEDYGGAIYQEYSKSCFIVKDGLEGDLLSPLGDARIQFDNNTSEINKGELIFANSLQPCLSECDNNDNNGIGRGDSISHLPCQCCQTEQSLEKSPANYLGDCSDAFSHIAEFTFPVGGGADNDNKQVSTHASVITSFRSHLQAIPGKETDMEFQMQDETCHSTVPYFQIIIPADANAHVATGYTYEGGKKLKFHGEPGTTLELKISPLDKHELELTLSVTLSECPPGYYYHRDKNLCVCSAQKTEEKNHTYIGIQACNPLTFQATLLHSHWAGYVFDDQANKTVLKTAFCPRGFCARSEKESKDIHLPGSTSVQDLSHLVCNTYREGILCARCKENHSVFFPTFSHCMPNQMCELGWLFYILSQLVPMTVLFSVILALNINLTSGALGSVLFYAQTFDLLHLTGSNFVWFQPRVYALLKSLRWISRASNLRFFARKETAFCLWEKAMSLDIIAFNYVSYIFALFLVVITVKCVKPCLHKLRERLHRREGRGSGVGNSRESGGSGGKVAGKLSHSIIHGLTGFLVLCYSQCTYISLHLTAYARLYGPGSKGGEYVVFFNGELKFFRGRHLLYAIPATFFFIIITVIPPLLLLCYPLCYKILAIFRLQESKFSRLLCVVLPLEKYKPLFDSFQGSFRDEHRYFAGLLFLYRLTILLTYAYVRVVATFYVLLQVELCCMLAIHAFVLPHRKHWHNALDTFIYLLLLIINSCSIYTYHVRADYVYNSSHSTAVGTFQVLIAYLPVLYVLGYVVMETWVLVRKWVVTRRRGRRRGRGSVGEMLEVGDSMREQLEEVLLARADEVNTSSLGSEVTGSSTSSTLPPSHADKASTTTLGSEVMMNSA